MRLYKQTKLLVAIDCIIFGFDGTHLKLLLIKRALQPQQGAWSLMGGFLQPSENVKEAANRILKELTGIENVYLEEIATFSNINRDPVERTISIACTALIDINQFDKDIITDFHAEWFHINQYPSLIFDHNQMVEKAKSKLRYKAAFHPILFELMPQKFTLPQLQTLYEELYDVQIDKRNFSRKILSMNLLLKQNEKEKDSSKKGAWLYKINKKNYKANFHKIANIIPNPENYLN
jgi:8-oxo-dGTP diphosphatase